MEGVDFEFEVLPVSITVGLAFHGLGLVVGVDDFLVDEDAESEAFGDEIIGDVDDEGTCEVRLSRRPELTHLLEDGVVRFLYLARGDETLDVVVIQFRHFHMGKGHDDIA